MAGLDIFRTSDHLSNSEGVSSRDDLDEPTMTTEMGGGGVVAH
jgi:hypothetical protein